MVEPSDLSVAVLHETVGRWLSTERFARIKEVARSLPPETDDEKLKAGIVEAVFSCLVGHLVSPLKRYSDNRKVLLRIQREAEKAVEAVQTLSASLDQLFPWSRDLLFEHFDLVAGTDLGAILSNIHLLWNLPPIASRHADLLKEADKGGRPELHAFTNLVEWLARAYERATGHPATVTNDPYGGKHSGPFIGLVDALLPSVEEMVDRMMGGVRPLELPISDYARGQKIREVLRRHRKAGNLTPPRVEL